MRIRHALACGTLVPEVNACRRRFAPEVGWAVLMRYLHSKPR